MTTLGEATVRPGHSYRHEAFFYRSDDDYLAGTLPMVRAGLVAVSRSWSPSRRDA